MLFADDTQASLLAAVALANSADPPDTMETVEALDAFFVEHAYSGRHDRTRAELDEVRAIRPALHELLTAERDEAITLVNDLLARHQAVPRLVRHDDSGWHLHAVDDDQPLATRIAVETAMGMSDVIRVDELSRLAVCADAECGGVVLDLSRNRSRRFCSTACGNRAGERRHR